MIVCWHGTSAENAESIRQHGFRPGTWFAEHLEDALAFGGNHIFSVCFDFDKAPGWQFVASEEIPIERIIEYKIYTVDEIYHNEQLGKKIFESNMSKINTSKCDEFTNVDDIIHFLNKLIEIDKDAIQSLVENRVSCNEELANHPTVRVSSNENSVGIIGIINGLFGIDNNGRGPITCVIDDDTGKLVKFIRTDSINNEQRQ